MSNKNGHFYRFKEFRLDVDERLLSDGDTSINLPPKIFDVLTILVERSGQLVEKDELLRLAWEDAFVEESNVARVIHSLRKVLNESADNKYIETIPKKGYRFIAEVEKINRDGPAVNGGAFKPTRDDCLSYVLRTGSDVVRVEDAGRRTDARAVTAEETANGAGGELPRPNTFAKRPAAEKVSGRRFRKFSAPAAAATVLLAIAIFGVWLAGGFRPSQKSAEGKSIAVLPLKPISTESRDAIYELGIAESLILKLSSARELTVRPLSATRKYQDLEQSATEAGREQRVDLVLSSNYQIAGDRIRVTSQLIDVRTGNVEEIFRSERNSADIFLMQEAIARDIGNTLLTRLGKSGNNLTARRGTSNEEAYRLYLQAAFVFDQWNKSEAGKAVAYLERAVELDPNFAEAYVVLAYAHRFFTNKENSPHDQYSKSMKAVEKALALNENLADAHAVLGLLKFSHEGDFAGAEREYKRAIELDPDSAMAHALYAYYLMCPGRFDEALAENRKAMEIDPASYAHQITYGMIMYYADRYEEAAEHYRRILEKDKNFVYAYFWMWLLCDLQGDETGAYEWFMKYQTQIKAPPETVQIYQNAYRKAGWKGVLREIVTQDEMKIAGGSYSDLTYEIACFSARLGDREKALDYLEKAVRQKNHAVIFIRVDPYLKSLHDEPRFEKIVKSIGLS